MAALVSTDLYGVDSRWAVLQGSLCVLSAEWAEETEDTLELLTKPKAARRPAGRRLELKPGGRRPDWLALGSRDLVPAAWGCAAAVAGAGGGAWWVKTWSSVRKAQNEELCLFLLLFITWQYFENRKLFKRYTVKSAWDVGGTDVIQTENIGSSQTVYRQR